MPLVLSRPTARQTFARGIPLRSSSSRHFHRTRAHVSKIRREVSKVAMGHAADPIHDHYRGLDRFAFHEEYTKFESGIDDALLTQKGPLK